MKTNIKNWFTDLFKKYEGAVPDTRPQSEKDKDWKAIEIYAPEPPHFRNVGENEWLKYQVRNQGQSGSCVANTIAKMLEVKYKLKTGNSLKFSHAPTYINRVNKPAGGMVGVDALQLAIKYSSCAETDIPSEVLSDAELDRIKLPENYESLNNYVAPTNYLVCPLDFDYVASMLNKEGAVMIWVDTSYSNWQVAVPTPGGRGGGVRHSITVVDAIKWNGQDYLVIEDSWGRFGRYDGQRLITRETFKTNVFFAAVLTEFKYDIVENDFKEFKTILNMGDRGEEVKRLQDFLKKEQLFPSNVPSSGYYGNITAKAVYFFQVREKVAPLSELDALKGKRVGSKTLLAINNKI